MKESAHFIAKPPKITYSGNRLGINAFLFCVIFATFAIKRFGEFFTKPL